MYDGKLVQTGSVHQVFDTPENEQVAAFVGMENLFEGTVVSQEGGIVTVVVGHATIEAVANYEKDTKGHVRYQARKRYSDARADSRVARETP